MFKSLIALFSKKNATSNTGPVTDNNFVAGSTQMRLPQEDLPAKNVDLEAKDPLALTPAEERAEEQWLVTHARANASFDKSHSQRQERPNVKPDWELENEERAARHARMQAPYNMTLNEFKAKILPALCRFPFMPNDVSQLREGDAKRLWLASQPITDASTWEEKYAARDAKDALFDWHPTVHETCRALRRNYETLRKAKAAGFLEVQAIVGRCACLRSISRKEFDIDAALAAFDVENAAAPLLPLADSACARLESPRVCDVMLITVEPPRPGDDPDFTAWMKQLFRERDERKDDV